MAYTDLQIRKYMYDAMEEHPEISSLFLFGSQNYGLATDSSNIDFVGIVSFPSDIPLQSMEMPYGKLSILGEKQCESAVLNADLRALEMLASPYQSYRGPRETEFVRNQREYIKNYGKDMSYSFIGHCALSVMKESFEVFGKFPPVEPVATDGYDGHILSHAIRKCDLIRQIVFKEDVSLLDWKVQKPELMLRSKLQSLTMEQAAKLALECRNYANQTSKDFQLNFRSTNGML